MELIIHSRVLLTHSLNSYCTYRHWSSTRWCQWRCYAELHRSSRIPGLPKGDWVFG